MTKIVKSKSTLKAEMDTAGKNFWRIDTFSGQAETAKELHVSHASSIYLQSTGKKLKKFPYINYCGAINDLRLRRELASSNKRIKSKIKNAVLYFIDNHNCSTHYGGLFRQFGVTPHEREIEENRTSVLDGVTQ